MSELSQRDIVERLLGCLRFDEPNDLETEIEKSTREAAAEIERAREAIELLPAR